MASEDLLRIIANDPRLAVPSVTASALSRGACLFCLTPEGDGVPSMFEADETRARICSWCVSKIVAMSAEVRQSPEVAALFREAQEAARAEERAESQKSIAALQETITGLRAVFPEARLEVRPPDGPGDVPSFGTNASITTFVLDVGERTAKTEVFPGRPKRR